MYSLPSFLSFFLTFQQGTLGARGSVSITVRYSPHNAGVASCEHLNLSIPGHRGAPRSLTIAGRATGPVARLSAWSLDFGDVRLPDNSTTANAAPAAKSAGSAKAGDGSGTTLQGGVTATVTRELVVFNSSSAPLHFSFLGLEDAPGAVFSVTPAQGTVAPLLSQPLTVRFRPALPINYYRRLFCLLHGQDPLYVDLLGTGFTDSLRPLPFAQPHVDAARARRLLHPPSALLPPDALASFLASRAGGRLMAPAIEILHSGLTAAAAAAAAARPGARATTHALPRLTHSSGGNGDGEFNDDGNFELVFPANGNNTRAHARGGHSGGGNVFFGPIPAAAAAAASPAASQQGAAVELAGRLGTLPYPTPFEQVFTLPQSSSAAAAAAVAPVVFSLDALAFAPAAPLPQLSSAPGHALRFTARNTTRARLSLAWHVAPVARAELTAAQPGYAAAAQLMPLFTPQPSALATASAAQGPAAAAAARAAASLQSAQTAGVGCFTISPCVAELGPGEEAQFTAFFRPPAHSLFAFQTLACTVYPKEQRSFRLVDGAVFTPPSLLTLPAYGLSSAAVSASLGTTNNGTAMGSGDGRIPTPGAGASSSSSQSSSSAYVASGSFQRERIQFPASSLTQKSFQTALLRNSGDTPLLFNFPHPRVRGFALFPATGTVPPGGFAVIALEFDPSALAREQQEQEQRRLAVNDEDNADGNESDAEVDSLGRRRSVAASGSSLPALPLASASSTSSLLNNNIVNGNNRANGRANGRGFGAAAEDGSDSPRALESFADAVAASRGGARNFPVGVINNTDGDVTSGGVELEMLSTEDSLARPVRVRGAHVFTCELNGSAAQSIPLIVRGEAFAPAADFPLDADSALFFKPTCLGMLSRRRGVLRNRTRAPLRFRFEIPPGVASREVSVYPRCGVIQPNDSVPLLWSFQPSRVARDVHSIPCHIAVADVGPLPVVDEDALAASATAAPPAQARVADPAAAAAAAAAGGAFDPVDRPAAGPLPLSTRANAVAHAGPAALASPNTRAAASAAMLGGRSVRPIIPATGNNNAGNVVMSPSSAALTALVAQQNGSGTGGSSSNGGTGGGMNESTLRRELRQSARAAVLAASPEVKFEALRREGALLALGEGATAHGGAAGSTTTMAAAAAVAAAGLSAGAAAAAAGYARGLAGTVAMPPRGTPALAHERTVTLTAHCYCSYGAITFAGGAELALDAVPAGGVAMGTLTIRNDSDVALAFALDVETVLPLGIDTAAVAAAQNRGRGRGSRRRGAPSQQRALTHDDESKDAVSGAAPRALGVLNVESDGSGSDSNDVYSDDDADDAHADNAGDGSADLDGDSAAAAMLARSGDGGAGNTVPPESAAAAVRRMRALHGPSRRRRHAARAAESGSFDAAAINAAAAKLVSLRPRRGEVPAHSTRQIAVSVALPRALPGRGVWRVACGFSRHVALSVKHSARNATATGSGSGGFASDAGGDCDGDDDDEDGLFAAAAAAAGEDADVDPSGAFAFGGGRQSNGRASAPRHSTSLLLSATSAVPALSVTGAWLEAPTSRSAALGASLDARGALALTATPALAGASGRALWDQLQLDVLNARLAAGNSPAANATAATVSAADASAAVLLELGTGVKAATPAPSSGGDASAAGASDILGLVAAAGRQAKPQRLPGGIKVASSASSSNNNAAPVAVAVDSGAADGSDDGGGYRALFLRLTNPSPLPARWRLMRREDSPPAADAGDVGAPSAAEQLSHAITDKQLFEITPRAGELAPGASVTVQVTYHHRFAGVHSVDAKLIIDGGATAAVRFAARTLSAAALRGPAAEVLAVSGLDTSYVPRALCLALTDNNAVSVNSVNNSDDCTKLMAALGDQAAVSAAVSTSAVARGGSLAVSVPATSTANRSSGSIALRHWWLADTPLGLSTAGDNYCAPSRSVATVSAAAAGVALEEAPLQLLTVTNPSPAQWAVYAVRPGPFALLASTSASASASSAGTDAAADAPSVWAVSGAVGLIPPGGAARVGLRFRPVAARAYALPLAVAAVAVPAPPADVVAAFEPFASESFLPGEDWLALAPLPDDTRALLAGPLSAATADAAANAVAEAEDNGADADTAVLVAVAAVPLARRYALVAESDSAADGALADSDESAAAAAAAAAAAGSSVERARVVYVCAHARGYAPDAATVLRAGSAGVALPAATPASVATALAAHGCHARALVPVSVSGPGSHSSSGSGAVALGSAVARGPWCVRSTFPALATLLAPGQAVTLSRQWAAFGDVPLGRRAVQLVTLRNHSTSRAAAFRWEALSLPGLGAGAATVRVEPDAGVIAPGQALVLRVLCDAGALPAIIDTAVACRVAYITPVNANAAHTALTAVPRSESALSVHSDDEDANTAIDSRRAGSKKSATGVVAGGDRFGLGRRSLALASRVSAVASSVLRPLNSHLAEKHRTRVAAAADARARVLVAAGLASAPGSSNTGSHGNNADGGNTVTLVAVGGNASPTPAETARATANALIELTSGQDAATAAAAAVAAAAGSASVAAPPGPQRIAIANAALRARLAPQRVLGDDVRAALRRRQCIVLPLRVTARALSATSIESGVWARDREHDRGFLPSPAIDFTTNSNNSSTNAAAAGVAGAGLLAAAQVGLTGADAVALALGASAAVAPAAAAAARANDALLERLYRSGDAAAEAAAALAATDASEARGVVSTANAAERAAARGIIAVALKEAARSARVTGAIAAARAAAVTAAATGAPVTAAAYDDDDAAAETERDAESDVRAVATQEALEGAVVNLFAEAESGAFDITQPVRLVAVQGLLRIPATTGAAQ